MIDRVSEHDRSSIWRGALSRPTHVGFARNPLCGDGACLMECHATVGEQWANPAYDANGNMTAIPRPGLNRPSWANLTTDQWSALTVDDWSRMEVAPTFKATYDAWNRLVRLTEPGATTTDPVQESQYDGRGYRIVTKTFTNGTLSDTRHAYFTDQWQVVEERLDTSTTPDRQFVWGVQSIDDLICRDRSTLSGILNQRSYATQDGNWNVTAIVDSTGTVQERYEYDAYGVTTVLAPDFSVRTASSFEWETTFSGYRLDTTALYMVRNRVYSAHIGTWLTPDPERLASPLNRLQYVSSRPVTYLDPFGLEVAGYNHGFPLFLGGTNSQPLFYMSQAQHTAFHNSLQSQLGARFGDSAREAFRNLTESQQDDVIRNALRSGGLTDDVIAQYWDDITKGANRGVKTWRGWQRGPRIGGPRPTCSSAGGTALKLVGTGVAVFLTLDSMAGTADAAEIRRTRLMRCNVTRVSNTQTAPTGLYSLYMDTEVVSRDEVSFELLIQSADISELESVRLNPRTNWSHSGFEESQWESFRVGECTPVCAED